MFLVVTVGGIISFLLTLGAAFVVIYFLIVIVGYLLAGTTVAGMGIFNAIKCKKFYEQCLSEGLTYTSQNREKIKLIGQYHNIKEPQKVFESLYIKNHPDEFPKEYEQKQFQRKTRRHKVLITGLSAILTPVIILLIIPPKDFSTDLLLVIVGIFMLMGIGIGACINAQIDNNKARKEYKEDLLNKIKRS